MVRVGLKWSFYLDRAIKIVPISDVTQSSRVIRLEAV